MAVEPGDEAHSLCKYCPNYAGCERRGSREGQAPPQLAWGPPASSISRGAGTLVVSFSSFLSALNQFFLFYFKFIVTTEGKAVLGAPAGSSAAWWSISGVLMPGNAAEIALWGHWMSNFKAHASTSFSSPRSRHTKAASSTHHCHPSSPCTNAGSFQEPHVPSPLGKYPWSPQISPPGSPWARCQGCSPVVLQQQGGEGEGGEGGERRGGGGGLVQPSELCSATSCAQPHQVFMCMSLLLFEQHRIKVTITKSPPSRSQGLLH